MATTAASKAGPRLAEVAGSDKRGRERFGFGVLKRIYNFQIVAPASCRLSWRREAAPTTALRAAAGKVDQDFSDCSSVRITPYRVASSTLGGRRNGFNPALAISSGVPLNKSPRW